MSISGREKEIEMLNLVVQDDKSHFIAVYGRRRIGKSELIKESYKNENYSHFVSTLLGSA